MLCLHHRYTGHTRLLQTHTKLAASITYCSNNWNGSSGELTAQETYVAMLDYYGIEARTMRQTLLFKHQHPREEWDPTLWEIPLCPLPKRLKAH